MWQQRSLHVGMPRSAGGVTLQGDRHKQEMTMAVYVNIPPRWDIPEHQITPESLY